MARQPDFKSWAGSRKNLVSYTLADGAESPISLETSMHALKMLSSISDIESTAYRHLITSSRQVMKWDARH
jgi:hypothetical protein